MKAVFAMILMLALYDASAAEIEVSRMNRVSGYSERYDLKTSLNEEVVLDCQSFIQGLLFGQLGESAILLQEWECEELTQGMKKSFRHLKTHCLEIDLESGVLLAQQTCAQ